MTTKECVNCASSLQPNEQTVCDVCLKKTVYISWSEVFDEEGNLDA